VQPDQANPEDNKVEQIEKQEKTTFEEWKQDATRRIAGATRIAGGTIGLR
jgi:hypothetical protein